MQFHEVRKLISKDFFYNFRYDSGELVCPDGLYNAIGPSKCSPKFELISDSLSESDFVIIIRWVWMVTLVVFGFFRIPSKVCHYWSYILSTPTLSAFFYDFSNNHFTGFSTRSKSVWVQWLAIHPEIDFDMPIRETDGNSSAGLWLANHIICVIPTCIILQLNWLGYLCNPTPNAPFMVSFIYQSKLLLFTFGWSVTVIYSLLRIVK